MRVMIERENKRQNETERDRELKNATLLILFIACTPAKVIQETNDNKQTRTLLVR